MTPRPPRDPAARRRDRAGRRSRRSATTCRTFWSNLIAGVSGVARITAFDPSDRGGPDRRRGEGLRAARLDGLQAGAPDEPIHPARGRRRSPGDRGCRARDRRRTIATTSRSSSTPVAAASSEVCARRGTSIQTSGPERVSPFMVPMMSPSMAACQVSIQNGIRGPVITVGRRLRVERAGLRRGAAPDRARRRRRRHRGRHRERHPAGRLRGAGQHGRALEAQRRPDRRVAAVRRGSRRLRLRRGAAVLVVESAEHAERRGAPVHRRDRAAAR